MECSNLWTGCNILHRQIVAFTDCNRWTPLEYLCLSYFKYPRKSFDAIWSGTIFIELFVVDIDQNDEPRFYAMTLNPGNEVGEQKEGSKVPPFFVWTATTPRLIDCINGWLNFSFNMDLVKVYVLDT